MKKSLIIWLFLYCPCIVFSQENTGQIHGDFNLSVQSYQEDLTIGAQTVDEIIRSNAHLNINYIKGDFQIGLRYESYLNALADYDPEFKGNGIPFRYATYNINGLEITAGNYYEQIGNGLIFRSYEEKGLGIDNAMDGIRLKYKPIKGLYLKTFIGKSRTHFTYSEGIFRAIDGDFNINELTKLNTNTSIMLGFGFISRYQERSNIVFKIPQNVGAYSARINLINGGWAYAGEFAYKINDPANVLSQSEMNYASGNAFTNSLTFSKKGFGFTIEMHRADNMTFKSDRDRDGKAYLINYIPTLTKAHSYSLLALYPYATQTDGELGLQADLYLNFKKGSLLGGKYGTKLDLNYARINALNGGSSFLNDQTNHVPQLISFSEELYFQDVNLEINKKINKKIKTVFVLANQTYNKDFLEGHTEGSDGVLNSTIIVADISYRIKKKHSVRMELQTLISKQLEHAEELADGDWSMGLIEYTISPNWFFTIQDMYNWGNEDPEKKLHYLNINVGFIKGANRFEIGYGKKREGIFCVGGICKLVPASNGFNLSVSSSF